MSSAVQTKTAVLYRVRVTQQDQVQIAFVPLERFIVGSLPSLPVVLRDKSVDKNHLVISSVEKQIWITDQQSSSGTRVNGKNISANVPIHYVPGDKIQLGLSDCTLQIHLFTQALDVNEEVEQVRTEAISQAEAIKAQAEAEVGRMRTQMTEQAEDEARRLAARIIQMAETKRHLIEEDSAKVIIENAEMRGREIIAGAEARASQAAEAADLKINALIEEAEIRAGEIIGDTNQRVIEIRKNAEIESQKAVFAATEGVPKILADAESKALLIVNHAKEKAQLLQNQARNQVDAIMGSAQIAALEIKNVADFQAKKLVEDLKKSAAQAAQTYHDEQTAEIREQAKLQTELERKSKVEGALSAATAECERIKQEAHLEAERILGAARHNDLVARTGTEKHIAELYEKDRQKSAEMAATRQAEADLILQEARANATLIKNRAHVEASQLIGQARQLIMEIRNGHEQNEAAKPAVNRVVRKLREFRQKYSSGHKNMSRAALLVAMWLPVIYFYFQE